MTNAYKVAADYLATWNEADAVQRLAKLEEGWTLDATYVDPIGTAKSLAQINDLIDAVRAKFPGHVFTSRGTPDGHGNYIRFSWTLSDTLGSGVAGGTDIAKLNDDDRIVSVLGFLDNVTS